MISIGKTLDVVVVSAKALNSGALIASSAARTSAKAAGSTPAIAALIAASSTVATPWRGGSTPRMWSGGCGVASRSEQTRSSVGGRIGTPSTSRTAAASASANTGPEQAQEGGVVLLRDLAQLVLGAPLERVRQHEH